MATISGGSAMLIFSAVLMCGNPQLGVGIISATMANGTWNGDRSNPGHVVGILKAAITRFMWFAPSTATGFGPERGQTTFVLESLHRG